MNTTCTRLLMMILIWCLKFLPLANGDQNLYASVSGTSFSVIYGLGARPNSSGACGTARSGCMIAWAALPVVLKVKR